ncbi:helix-turn-helix transcriptional regulator [Methanohalophilus portucalensis]|nr:winged helix-turn-helix domain-containing protein [Methanohalophilus portucalensis]OJH50325.1 ArsR family transcriptional regulator [Methanohalophilus portucalensis FDF-1]SMH28988.1 Predicted transcriptional regulator, contains HTH domain [Methanohalophilus portucalensis FDF-1]
MRRSLIDITCFSEKRKRLLLLLMEGKKDIDEIKEVLDETSPSILPQIKILKENGLIVQENGTYSLTRIGMLLVHMLQEVFQTFDVLEDHFDYFNEHDLTPIPKELLNNIGELNNSEYIVPSLTDAFDPFTKIKPLTKASIWIKAFIAVYHPEYPPLASEMVSKGANLSLIMTEPMFEKMKNDYPEATRILKNSDNSRILIYKGEVMPSLIIASDQYFLLSLMLKTCRYDNSYLMGTKKEAIEWATKLYEWYEKKSELVPKKD